VFLIVLVAILFRIFGSSEALNLTVIQEADRVAQADTLLNICEGSENEARCLEGASQDAAALTGDTDYCQDLEGDAYDDCVWGVAREMLDATLCDDLQNTEYVIDCQDSVYRKLAYSGRDTSYCEQLSDAVQVEGCIESIEGALTFESCEADVSGAEYCEYLRVKEQAAAAQDRSLCGSLSEEYIVNCRETVHIDDADFDGVETELEMFYGSDPYLADTDGDGYTDKEEIDAGYNPNGEGKLE